MVVEGIVPVIWTGVIVVIIVAISYAIGHAVALLVRKIWLAPRKVELSTELMISRVIKYSITIVGSLIAIAEIPLNILPLLMGLGVVGLAVAFGVQEIVANMISGLIILIDKPLRVGDVVEVETATGTVMDIGLRASTVRTMDNINVLVPNKLIILHAIKNYSKYDPKLRISVPIGVAYGSDMEKVRQVLLSIAQDHPKVLKEPAPEARLVEFGNSSVNFVLYAWIEEPSMRVKIRDEMNLEIDKRFRQNKITIPFPQLDVWMKK